MTGTWRKILSSGRWVPTMEEGDDFFVLPHGRAINRTVSVHGPYSTKDPRFSSAVIGDLVTNDRLVLDTRTGGYHVKSK